MTDFGLQQHGKRLVIDSNQDKIAECLMRINTLSTEGSNYLTMLCIALLVNPKVIVPCQKCLKDAALQFIDLGNAMNELVDLCEKK